MTEWVPVVDVSRHQGQIDFDKMKAAGVHGLILRISHGLVLDSMVERYYPQAVDAGFAPVDIGFYPFINPKRSSGADAAEFAVEAIQRITGDLDFFYMLDVENYAQDSPDIGDAPVFGPQFAAWLREHIATVNALAPVARVIGYSNRAYWNGKIYKGSVIEWVGDDALAAELDWLVARYVAYSDAQYARVGYPPTPDKWDEWAMKAQPAGPIPPRGADGWRGWQPSAGFNKQGATYGASSTDLDLDIVHPEAWARWTRSAPLPPPNPQPGDDVIDVARDAETNLDKFAVMPDGTLRPLSGTELKARGITNSLNLGVPLTKAERDALGTYTPGGGTVDQVARDEAAHANEGLTRVARTISDIRMGGQRIADAGGM